MDAELQEWIQQNTNSRVTDKFVETLRQVARLHDDVNKFIVGAKALGKFKGKDDFLQELYEKFRSDKKPTSVIPAAAPTFTPRKKFLVKRSIDDDENEGDDDEIDSLDILQQPFKRKSDQRLTLKRITKQRAAELKEFSLEEPKTVTMKREDDSNDRVSDKETSDLDDIKQDQDFDTQDRNWYDNDDDFDNVIQNDKFIPDQQEQFYDDKTLDVSEPEIQLNSLALNERKSLIPPFLLDFQDRSGEFAIIGATDLSSKSNKGIADPIKNPESDFCINARKGSKLVALKRMYKDRKSKSQAVAELKGSALGTLLGVENSPTKGQSKQNNEPKIEAEAEQSFEDIQKVRRSLPAYKVRHHLLKNIRDNQVTVIVGETGSGKTTQLAQFLYEDGFTANDKIIGCTQPRRVAAVSVAERVAKEMDSPIGQKVGYSIRFEDQTTDSTKIKFMTDGILLREAMLDPLLEKYSCIIMDEAHERSLNTDVLLGIFKTLLARRRDLKLVVTSATMNADKFSRFFGNAPQYFIPGKTFPVEVIYSNHPVQDYVEATVQKALDIHLSTPVTDGDILVFMTGQEDIEATCSTIIERLTEIYTKKYGANYQTYLADVQVLPIYSSLPADVQGRIFQKQKDTVRKIVVATNIAETSLTVDGIKYVIDCGYSKLKVYNPKIGLDSLRITPISLANANQRSGRAGRTGPGIAYRLYTQDSAIEDMYPQAIPEIQRTNLANTLLQLKSLNIDNLSKFPFIDPPPSGNLMASLYDLWTLGALDNFGNLTRLGKLMGAFPLQPFLSRVLISASKHGCSEEMLTIVSMLSVPSVFYRPKEREEESDQARNRFLIPESDHLTLLNVYGQWKANKFSAHWCNSHFIQFRSLQRAREIRQQLLYVIKRQNLPMESSGADWAPIRKCLCTGYTHQAAKLSGLGKYVHLKTGMDLKVHPTSALFGLGDLPSYVVYHELLMTTNEYINVVTAVDPLWLMEYSGIFYHIKRRKEQSYRFGETTSLRKADNGDIDKIDIQIDKLKAVAQGVINKLQSDKSKFTLNRSDSTGTRRKENGNDDQPVVRIGIKKRIPF
ncbi:unnamed protein product [Kluyveromyces dobzhanskii CBS 2104]|uniref:Pre-mRNA-splicing factor ATP-dependent RNA helicase PRP16 n=1 Tax=Kluyveromyces dobzhanskii CBS 2104 TaxID=1427455 RepID=A0A0A8KZ69_9SACH|nr:unnamed protein product [Kluyveromyces dobzhanskii CBS 2104]